MNYEGRVYDGPWEGRNLAHHSLWYPFYWLDRGPMTAYCPIYNELPPVAVTAKQFEYRWSHSLRAWVFVWPR